MRWVTVYDKTLRVTEQRLQMVKQAPVGFADSITAFAIHELLFEPLVGDLPPLFPALTAVRARVEENTSQSLVWIDPAQTFYPLGAFNGSLIPGQLSILRPAPADLTWAAIECLRCKQVGAVVVLLMHRPTRVEVRRLQLAVEQGGGVGILLRPNHPSAGSNIYAAATRWLVAPARGERTIQRWHIRQIHGQGRWSSFFLEKHRATGQTNFVYPSAPVVHQPVVSATS